MSDNENDYFDNGEFIQAGDENRITEVVVYTDQAYLKRRIHVSAQEAINRFLIEIQAFVVDVDSAQANVYGEGEILSVQYREIPVKHAPQEGIRELELNKEQLEDQRRALNNEKSVGDKQVKFLDSVIEFAETDLPQKIKTQFPATENLNTMLEFLGTNYRKIAEHDIDLRRQIEEFDKKIIVVERRLKESRRPNENFRKVIEVVFDSSRQQDLDIEVAYVAQVASWEPVYKVDVPLALDGVAMTMFSRIRQKTGENWNMVKLAVSNAIPLKGAALPDLHSWHLSLPPEPALMAGAIAATADAGAVFDTLDEQHQPLADEVLEDLDDPVGVGPAPQASFQEADQTKLPLAFEYELPQQITMKSGDGETLLPLFTKRWEGNFYIHSVPQNDPLAYLVCRILPDRALLAGRLNVHFGGRFVGGTAFSEKKAGQDLLISLGAERGLKIQREKLTDKLAETFFGRVERSMVARELEYRIQLENLKDEAVKVELYDSIPVSKTDRFQVKGLELSPQPTVVDYQEREGVMKWEVRLKPKAIEEIRIKFFVKHPKGLKPRGL
ncbi:MAG: mucoidy inhibitor MuiA family protein [bacterium]|nr:mucoidy inhibitor MuiA family protein [bacterium]